MTHPKSKPDKRLEPSGVIELSLGADQYATLVAAGVLGALPVTTWLLMSMTPLGLEGGSAPGTFGTVAIVAFVVIALVVMLVLPWLVPVLVLRSRQPRGARIEWNDEGVIEWDGPWKKTFIAWPELRATQVTWVTKTRSGSITDEALQLLGAEAKTAITCWTSKPRRSPVVRRRVCSARVVELREAIEARRIPLANGLDFDLVGDADRPPHRALSIVGRIGYPLAVFAPLVAPGSAVGGVALGAASAVLLGARAAPVFGELRAIRARRRSLRRTISGDEAVGPYRAAFAPAPDEDAGLLARDRFKARAAMIEAVVRGSCVVMTLASTALSLAFLR